MSINSAMLAGVSGLVANSSALAAISDNIANVNTVGYKRTTANFSSLVTSSSKASNYSAGGLKAITHKYIRQEGNHMGTSSNLDLAISGSGFFVTTTKSENNLPTDQRLFTRAGAFVIDDLGYLRNDAGLYLQGWLADNLTGEITTDPSDLSQLDTINVSGTGGTAEATTRVAISANLSNQQPTTTFWTDANADGIYDPGEENYDLTNANQMAEWHATGGTSGLEPDFEINIPVSDSQGSQRNITMAFMRSGNANEWVVEVYGDPSIIEDGGAPNLGKIASGTVNFNPDGTISTADPTLGGLFPTAGGGNPPTIVIAASDDLAPTGPKWATALGIAQQTIQIDLTTAPGGLTQFSSLSEAQNISANGTPFGVLADVQIDKEGYVTAIYENGTTRRLAQVAIATFSNPDALISQNGNAYQVSRESGTYTLKAPGAGGAGEIDPSTLEASTVDLSTEFTGLITTQRAYSASSKIITTADEMLAELISIKR